MITLSVHDYAHQKQADLYCSGMSVSGQAYDIVHTEEINGWKSLEFSLPHLIEESGKHVDNPRLPYAKNEYLVRYVEDGQADWFIINLPVQEHQSAVVSRITCGHISCLLNRKKLYLVLDDTNGIGTLPQIASLILQNTGWSVGICDMFLEADGQTEKVRSLKSDGKEGAYQQITNVCNLFNARPIYHGDTRTVDFFALTNREKMLEFTYEKNLTSVRLEHNSESLVTRLYVEGIFDELGYIGIEDVNPTGLGFLLNFDYFRQLGLFTDDHEAALSTYLDNMRIINGRIINQSRAISEKKTELNTLWGQCRYAIWEALSQSNPTTITVGAPITNHYETPLDVGDEVVVLRRNGQYTRTKVVQYVEAARIIIADDVPDATHVLRFITPAAGVIGGKEVTIEAKEKTIDSLEKKIAQTTDEKTRENYRQQISTTQQEIQDLLFGNSTSLGLYAQMRDAVLLAVEISVLQLALTEIQREQGEIEHAFVDAMGEMLRDGYWNDPTYVKGQELALYSDGLDMIEAMSKPLVSYRIGFLDLSGLDRYKDERVDINMAVRVFDAEIALNDFCFVTKITRHIDAAWKNQVEISNQVISIAGQTFDSILSRMAELSNQINGRKAIFERAAIINPDGTIPAEVLDGIIEVNRNKLHSTTSSWYTDDNGNLVFKALDGGSAMMLTGAGFMIAAEKDDQGEWNWRSFGTGKGFTADEMIAGELRTGLVRILGTDRFYWDQANIYIIDPLNTDRQIRIGLYDGEHYGIAFTQDGGATWQNALDFDGLHFSFGNIPAIYKIDIIASHGVMLSNGIPYTQLVARLYRGSEDVTDATVAARFQWERISGDPSGDTHWNLAHRGMKMVTVTTGDVQMQATFRCNILSE